MRAHAIPIAKVAYGLTDLSAWTKGTALSVEVAPGITSINVVIEHR
jgi:hypothetical protein